MRNVTRVDTMCWIFSYRDVCHEPLSYSDRSAQRENRLYELR